MDRLVEQLAVLRNEMADIKSQIMVVEQDIIAQTPGQKLEGTTKTEWGSVTNRLTRKLDYDAYLDLEDTILESVKFVELKPTISLKKLRLAEAVNPDMVAACVTVKPAKPAIKIKGM